MSKKMNNLSNKDLENLIKILKEGKEIPAKYHDIFCKKEEVQKEYELTYDGKAREEDIIADTLSAPLQEVRTFNSDNKYPDGWTNKLIFGDNLMALKNLYEDPNIKGKIKLVYIDPPFATKQDFMKDEEKAYKDRVVGAKFLEFVRKRLVLLREILSNDGVIFMHMDQKKGHHLKLLMDEVFLESRFKNEIIWCYTQGGRPEDSYPNKHDTIYVYSRSQKMNFYPDNIKVPYELVSEKSSSSFTKIDKDGRKYKEIYGPGKKKLYRYYEDEGKVPFDWWTDIPQITGRSAQSKETELTNYPTQKPEKLLQRVIAGCTKEGELVLDAFAGSGTTLAVAEKLKRKWIGIDCGKLAIYTMQKRMLNLKKEIGNKGKSLTAKSFTLYNAGLYDWQAIKDLDFEHYRDFVLKLFQVREEVHKVRGIEIDGYIGNDNAYLWNHTTDKRAKLDIDFVKSLHEAISGKGGEVFYIIAPTNAFAFFEDEVKLDDTTYKTLRVPQSVITELIKRGGKTLKQPASEQDVNDTIDAVGFDFIQVPEVETELKISKPKEATLLNMKIKECVIKINKFKSRTLTKSPEEFENYETLSMVMVDYDYDRKVFDLDEVFYADQIKPDYEVRFDSSKLKGQMMVIYLDVYGNEKKKVLTLKDFKKK
ncbi:site-specific DNA-methyltransferase [Candidatus Woesebacteria bacterium]|nr:site-specific DNA-methyltransferase [Candidatus Woesebacteria bacterium]